MSKVKFRVFDKYYRSIYDVVEIIFDERIVRFFIVDKHDNEEELVSRNFNDVCLMQYTGLKDKNGVEIYEVDVVRIKDDDSVFRDDIARVVFNYTCFVFKSVDFEDETIEHIRRYYIEHGWYEVIGNIYKNPELLEAQE